MTGSTKPAKAALPRIELDLAVLEIVPLSPDRWDDLAALFGEGGDPKTCLSFDSLL